MVEDFDETNLSKKYFCRTSSFSTVSEFKVALQKLEYYVAGRIPS